MKFRITFWIFQNGALDEELEVEQEFTDATELAQALASFATKESALRNNPKVYELIIRACPRLNMPSTQQGYGPATNVVIREIEAI